MKFRPSSFEIKALLLGKLYASYHPQVIVRERQRVKKQMLKRGQFRGHLPVTDKFRVRIYDNFFGKRN